ncbi:Cysteine and glycine-rich protein 1 [Apophysomyces ossiformis]|uniref:Cysteine and glycine-rich protein 1 n=1 Tax=Apophysomyces ossiformis TaxID=679940 RepID=A0A8H7ES31_9FUNG|nr:Cysteine and glycine-rich protein 1 [Apophysomyces ossiformis]
MKRNVTSAWIPLCLPKEKERLAYCKVCYTRKWGPKGYGFAGGAAFLSTESKMPSEIVKQAIPDSVSSPTMPVIQPYSTPPIVPPKPTSASTISPSSSAQASPKLPPRPRAASLEQTSINTPPEDIDSPTMSSFWSKPATKPAYTKTQTSYVPRKLNFTVQNDTCTKCGKAVYAAELALGAGNKYHKLCLKCCQCGKLLSSTNMVDRDFDLYCRGCYAKSFGPKYVIPTLVIELLDEQWSRRPRPQQLSMFSEADIKAAKDALLSISRACALALQYQISEDDLADIRKHVTLWHLFLKKYLPISVFTINEHLLLHLMDAIAHLGPLRYCSTRPMERIIGMLKPRIRSRSRPQASAANALIYSSAAMYSIALTVEAEDREVTLKAFKKEDLSAYVHMNLAALVTDFWRREDEHLEELPSEIYVAQEAFVNGIRFFAKKAHSRNYSLVRLRLPVDQKARCGFRSQQDLQWKTFFGEVQFFFHHSTSSTRNILCYFKKNEGLCYESRAS